MHSLDNTFEGLVNRAGLMMHWGMTQKRAFKALCKDVDPNTAFLAVKGAVTLQKCRDKREKG